jgi:hypothetical protein
VASTALAQEPFDGTWRVKLEQSEFSKKPIELSLQGGRYKCTTCAPQFDVKADGTDQKVTGAPWYDTISATVSGNNALKEVRKQSGKVVATSNYTVSADKNTLTETFEAQPEGSTKPVTGTQVYTRAGQAPAQGNAVSGSWEMKKLENLSESGQTVTFDQSKGSLAMTSPAGQSYTAKFDGKDYPFKGDPSVTHVQLKKISERSIEESGFYNGKPVYVSNMSISPDGKSMTIVVHDKLRDRESKFAAVKEQK